MRTVRCRFEKPRSNEGLYNVTNHVHDEGRYNRSPVKMLLKCVRSRNRFKRRFKHTTVDYNNIQPKETCQP